MGSVGGMPKPSFAPKLANRRGGEGPFSSLWLVPQNERETFLGLLCLGEPLWGS